MEAENLVESRPCVKREDALAELKRDSLWRLSRIAHEHVARLLWAIEQEDDVAVREHCRAMVSHVKAVVVLVNDLTAGGARE